MENLSSRKTGPSIKVQRGTTRHPAALKASPSLWNVDTNTAGSHVRDPTLNTLALLPLRAPMQLLRER